MCFCYITNNVSFIASLQHHRWEKTVIGQVLDLCQAMLNNEYF